MAARLDRLHGGDAAPVLLRAFPIKTSGTGREYNGFVYATLRDPRTFDTFDARIPVSLTWAASLACSARLVYLGPGTRSG
jgi:hypothetical protein